MTHLIEFPLDSGGSVLVEATERTAGPVTRGLKGPDVVERAHQTFEEAFHRVRPAVDAALAQLRGLAARPDEVRIDFALTLHAEAGAFIAAVGSTANFAVALTWRRSEESTPPEPGPHSEM